MLKIFLAVLLSIPINAKDEEYVKKLSKFNKEPGLKTEILQWAFKAELFDPQRENQRNNYFFDSMTDNEFVEQCSFLRQRYEYLNDAPHLFEANRFPAPGEIMKLLAINKIYEEGLANQCLISGQKDWYDAALKETRLLSEIWSQITLAKQDYYNVNDRREALRFVKDKMGEKAFYSGEFPPYIPLWRFRSIEE